jgi:hypothetical protein
MSEVRTDDPKYKEGDPNQKKYQRDIDMRLRVIVVGCGRHGGLRVERDSAILRDDGGNLSGELQNGGAGVATF